VVDVRRLTPDGTSQLAQTYLDYFRIPALSAPTALYPFTPEAIGDIYDAAKGNIRACLQALNYAIEAGIDADGADIDRDFLVEHHLDITGRVHADEVTL